MRGASSIILLAGALAAYVIFDLVKTIKTGRAIGRIANITRKGQPQRFWRYVYASYFVLAACLALICWAVFRPESFR